MLGQWSYVLFAVGVFNLILGLLVLLRNAKNKANIVFASLSVAIGLWVIGIAGFGLANTPIVALLFAKLFYVAPLFVALTFAYFALLFPNGRRIHWHILLATGLPVAGLVIALLVQPTFITEHIVFESWGNAVVVNQGHYFAYALVVMALFGYALLSLLRKLKHLRGLHHTQVQWFFVMGIIVSGIGVWFNIILAHWLGDYRYVWVGPLATTIFLISTTISIVKHGMFDIRAVTARSLAYALSLVALAGIYYLLAYVMSIMLFSGTEVVDTSVSLVNVALALTLAFAFQPVKRFFDHFTDRIFYHGSYDQDEFTARLGGILMNTSRLKDVLQLALNEITSTLKSDNGLFIVYRDERDDVMVGKTEFDDFTEKEHEQLRDFAAIIQPGLVVVDAQAKYDDPEAAKVHRLLARRRVALVLPLVNASETIGYLLLGEQLGASYSQRDIRVLETIANELVIAIMNARSVQAVRDLNTHLEERVLNSTRQLLRTNKRLLEMDETKDEFLSMASHQLRTPLTSVKGYISMVLEGDVGDVTPDQRKLLEEAYTSSERMVHLIGDFLNVSRLQTGKFVIDRKQSDLAKVVRQEVDGIRQIATTHGVAITYKPPARFPELYLDEGKIRQVIMNFIDNAIYYSPEGGDIKVTLRLEDGDAVVCVIDKGMGVPAAVQKRLFTKFFRAENARKQRPDGTGIGLYLAKKVIDGHGGTLVFESKEGKGSTFGFRLPIKKLSTPPPPDPDIIEA